MQEELTPDEWLDRFLASNRGVQIEIVKQVLDANRASHECFTQDHSGQIKRYEELEARAEDLGVSLAELVNLVKRSRGGGAST